LTSKTRRIRSAPISASGSGGATIPALTTTPVSGPSSRSAASKIATTSLSTATSAFRAVARPPPFAAAATISSAAARWPT
jgi:hypothetical protein